MPDSADSAGVFLVAVAVVAAALVLVPVVFFGAELIVVGVLLAGGVASHVVLRRPWMVEAISTDPVAPARRLEWQVRGWRRSGTRIDEVVADLATGREPARDTVPG